MSMGNKSQYMLRTECNDRFDKLEKLLKNVKFQTNGLDFLNGNDADSKNQVLEEDNDADVENKFVRYLMKNLKFSVDDITHIEETKEKEKDYTANQVLARKIE